MEKDIVQYHYDELIKSLVTLSSPAEKQKYIMGYGHVGDDMIIEFENHYNLGMADYYFDIGLFTDNQLQKIDDYDKFLDEKSGEQELDFFTDFDQLNSNPIWEEIRVETSKLLRFFDKDNLDIEVTREVDNKIELTRTRLYKVR
ncbi:hypothetical protein GCM10008018_71440 [Paenibacillus marchantiophytorum]|uniref:DUF600 family protein n=1 Tax=Paenibacillus marchantiophytorum TaxID=1619310 RepID=A0ABQ1FIF3_9BACL|nr:hypothetical protein [Paenibacillus marchantiophytorum]GGA16717.1 hypothetical protein GCM10008018_71440 [Paenibacillus marchantiophytorum]